MFGLIFGVIILIAGLVAMKFVPNRFKGLTATAGVVLAAVLVITACISYVPTGYTGIRVTFGRVHNEVLDAGINFHAPWDNVIKMDNREQRVPFELQAFSSDIQEVEVKGSVNLNINPSTAMNLYRSVGVEYQNILVSPRVLEDVKVVISDYTAENLISNRNSLSSLITDLLRNDLTNSGINIITVAIEDLDFSDVYTNSIEAKQVATQDKLRAQTQQEQQTMEATEAAKRKKIEAEAAAEVAKIKADAEAYSIKVEAAAKAEANKSINESLTQALIEYTQINTWDGKMPLVISGENGASIFNLPAEILVPSR